jgi:hypothetical protein
MYIFLNQISKYIHRRKRLTGVRNKYGSDIEQRVFSSAEAMVLVSIVTLFSQSCFDIIVTVPVCKAFGSELLRSIPHPAI